MDKQEKIVCAAVKVTRVKSDYKGVKIVIGVDYQSIYNDGVLSYLANDQDTNIWQNGFITSKKCFVDAKEAMGIAIEQDQILEINNCFAEFHEAQLAENFRKVNALLGELQSLKLKYASRELKPEDLY